MAASVLQPDWNETDVNSPSFIKNKPGTKPVTAGTNVTITETSENFVISSNGESGELKYSIDTSDDITWDIHDRYASSSFTLTDGGDNGGIEYWESSSKKTGYYLETGHVYQLNFNASMTPQASYGSPIPGYIYTTGTQEQEWHFVLDGSLAKEVSVSGSTLIRCTSDHVLYFNIRVDGTFTVDNLPVVNFEKVSIIDMGAL